MPIAINLYPPPSRKRNRHIRIAIPAQPRKASMQIIRSPADAANIADPAIREMILQRIDAIASDEPYDANLHGYFLIIESGDKLQAINQQVGFDLLAKPYEILEQYPDCYDLLCVVSDDGYAVELFTPKTGGIDHDLLSMCQRHAVAGTL